MDGQPKTMLDCAERAQHRYARSPMTSLRATGEDRRSMSTIVVGVDGSVEAKEALRWALAEARLRGATLRVVHAWSFPVVPAEPGFAAYHDAELLRALQQDA